MHKILIAVSAIAVGALGFGAGRWSSSSQDHAAPAASRSTASARTAYQHTAPAIGMSEARDHRESGYADLGSIDGVLGLPSDFAQTEALYVVAGRASRAELEQLITQSIDIVNRFDRSAALNILFSRYAELDPDAAVDYLIELNLDIDDQVFSTVFEAWTKFDLNGAVAGVNRLTNVRQRRRAGRAVLTATSRYHQGLVGQVLADLPDNHDLARIHGEAIGIRANQDPRSAMQEAMGVDGLYGRFNAVNQVAAVWARNDPAGALRYTSELSDRNMRRRFVAAVLRRWIQDDPLQAMQYINAHPNETERHDMLEQGLGVYAQIQPEEALELASQLPGRAKTQALQQVLGQWAKDDIDGAMNAINALDSSAQRTDMMSWVGQSLVHQGTEKALAWLEVLDSESRATQMPVILQQIAQHDPRRALEYAMNNSTENDRTTTLNTVMQFAIMSNPDVAQDYLALLPASTARDGLYQQLGQYKVQNDSEETLRWIAGLEGTAKASALRGAAHAMAATDPGMSATLISHMSAAEATQLLQTVSTTLSYRDPQAAMTWLEQFNGRPGYEPALAQVVQAVARTDPQQALGLTMKLSGNNRSVATRGALASWASANPAAAANWARYADSSVREAAIESVVRTWGRSDPSAAERWVFSLPTGASQDVALVQLAMSSGDSGRMADYIGSISSDAIRRQAIINAYQGMRVKPGNEQNASEFLDNVGADNELRDQLFDMGGQ